MRTILHTALLTALLISGGSPLLGAQLDWSSVSWPTNTSGANLNESYNNVGGTTVDMTFDFPTSGTPYNADAGTPNPETSAFGPFPGGGPNFTPKISTDKTTDDALLLFVDFTTGSPNEYVTLNISFSELVKGVNMTVYDIDYAEDDFQDFVIIRGVLEDGTIVAPTTLTNDAPYNYTSTGFPSDFDGTIFDDSSGSSTLQDSSIVGWTSFEAPDGAPGTWDFGDQELVGLQMVYTNSRRAPNNPNGQAISLGNVFFTPVVPEAETYWAAAALLLLLGGFSWRKYASRA